jgi:hypothetical protein
MPAATIAAHLFWDASVYPCEMPNRAGRGWGICASLRSPKWSVAARSSPSSATAHGSRGLIDARCGHSRVSVLLGAGRSASRQRASPTTTRLRTPVATAATRPTSRLRPSGPTRYRGVTESASRSEARRQAGGGCTSTSSDGAPSSPFRSSSGTTATGPTTCGLRPGTSLARWTYLPPRRLTESLRSPRNRRRFRPLDRDSVAYPRSRLRAGGLAEVCGVERRDEPRDGCRDRQDCAETVKKVRKRPLSEIGGPTLLSYL